MTELLKDPHIEFANYLYCPMPIRRIAPPYDSARLVLFTYRYGFAVQVLRARRVAWRGKSQEVKIPGTPCTWVLLPGHEHRGVPCLGNGPVKARKVFARAERRGMDDHPEGWDHLGKRTPTTGQSFIGRGSERIYIYNYNFFSYISRAD